MTYKPNAHTCTLLRLSSSEQHAHTSTCPTTMTRTTTLKSFIRIFVPGFALLLLSWPTVAAGTDPRARTGIDSDAQRGIIQQHGSMIQTQTQGGYSLKTNQRRLGPHKHPHPHGRYTECCIIPHEFLCFTCLCFDNKGIYLSLRKHCTQTVIPISSGSSSSGYMGCLDYSSSQLSSKWIFKGQAPACSSSSSSGSGGSSGGSSGSGGSGSSGSGSSGGGSSGSGSSGSGGSGSDGSGSGGSDSEAGGNGTDDGGSDSETVSNGADDGGDGADEQGKIQW